MEHSWWLLKLSAVVIRAPLLLRALMTNLNSVCSMQKNASSHPELSVIIPCFNCESSISTAVNSVLIQDVRMQIIIIDDCSRDGTLSVIRRLEKRFSSIEVIALDANMGPAVARNRGLDSARGDFIAFLDGDDWWLRGKCRRQIDYMRANDLEFTYHDYYHIRYKGNQPVDFAVVRSPTTASMPSFFYKRNYGMCLTSMISKRLAKTVRFPHAQGIVTEDYGFFLQIVRQGVVGVRMTELSGVYTSQTHNRSANKLRQAVSVCKVNLLIFRNKKLLALFGFVMYALYQISARVMTRTAYKSIDSIDVCVFEGGSDQDSG